MGLIWMPRDSGWYLKARVVFVGCEVSSSVFEIFLNRRDSGCDSYEVICKSCARARVWAWEKLESFSLVWL